ncbi:unnamed protein product [Durusdinium trenchii]|uniref:VIT domain-containing protein n=1 Tax=Durusdinium trenchii TaxID=1381693 RepID=A0ABP0RLW7_9DINO
MEGRFSFQLPIGPEGSAAMPSRLAMEIQGKLMEGEVVNRSKAQKVYREILHEARDPALLEQSQGNIFTARVFPIDPHAVVRLILSYTITIPMRNWHRTLTIPLAGLPEIHNFSFAASVRGFNGGFSANCTVDGAPLLSTVTENEAMHFATEREHYVAQSDVQIDLWEPLAVSKSFSVDGGQMVSSFVIDESNTSSRAFSPDSWIVYVDTSASTADSVLVRLPLIQAFLEVKEIRPRSPKDGSIGFSVRSSLEESETLGILILSDCIATANERAAARLGQLLTPVQRRIVQLGVLGTKFDSALGAAVASAGHGRIVHLPLTSKDLPSVVSAAWNEIQKPLGLHGRVTADSSGSWQWPQSAFDLHDGDELVVFSGGGTGITLHAPTLALGARVENAGAVSAAAAAFSSLLTREASRARLELLEAERQLASSKAKAKEIEDQLVRLSEESRVMTPHTALLVLETDADYVRFGIPQDRLSPILRVTSNGVELQSREAIQTALPPLPVPLRTPQELEGEDLELFWNFSNSSECAADQSECQMEKEETGRVLFTWLLLLVTSFAAWSDPEKDADEVLAEHQEPPKERLRDTAAAWFLVERLLGQGNYCASWITWDPSNDLAFEYLSKAAMLLGEVAPRSSEQLLRGAWLSLSLGDTSALAWARRFGLRSLEEREDNANTYRALAMAYWQDVQLEQDFKSAAQTYERALGIGFHSRYGDVKRVLREEAALMLRSLRAMGDDVDLHRNLDLFDHLHLLWSLGRDVQNPVKIVENIRLDAPCSASAALALASTYALRYGSSAARAAVLREARQAAKARAAPKGHGCCAESLELQLPELPSAGLKVKWPAKLSVKRGEVIEILVVNDTGSKAGSLNGSNVLVWLVSDSALFGGHGHA